MRTVEIGFVNAGRQSLEGRRGPGPSYGRRLGCGGDSRKPRLAGLGPT